MALSDLVRDIKAHSSKFMNEKQWYPGKFAWQDGFGTFSYSHSHLDKVIDYIRNQEKHHAKRTFQEEYLRLLRAFDISFDEKYVFKWIEETTSRPYGAILAFIFALLPIFRR